MHTAFNAPAQAITAPAQLITTPFQPPATEVAVYTTILQLVWGNHPLGMGEILDN